MRNRKADNVNWNTKKTRQRDQQSEPDRQRFAKFRIDPM